MASKNLLINLTSMINFVSSFHKEIIETKVASTINYYQSILRLCAFYCCCMIQQVHLARQFPNEIEFRSLADNLDGLAWHGTQ